MCNKENTPFEEYFDKVECYFALKRDKALLLSPEEFTVVERFYEEGAPLKVIFRGIDRFFEKKKKRKRKSARIYFLTHVEDYIGEVWEEYKRKGTGSYLVSGESEADFITSGIDQIISSLSKCHPALSEVAKEVEEKLLSVKSKSNELTLEDAERELDTILEFATKRIFDILNNDLSDVKDEVDAEVESLVNSLGKDVKPDVVDRFKTQIIFEKLNFPNITLFG